MSTVKNSDLLKGILGPLYTLTGMKSSQGFAITVIGAITKTLEKNYAFLQHIRVNQGEYFKNEEIEISPEIDNVDPYKVGKAIETIVRIVYMDLKGKAGLFFIKELKKRTDENVILELEKRGVNLDLLQIEQRYIQKRQYIKKSHDITRKIEDDKPLLDYKWSQVASWEYDENKNVCILYKDDGKELDRLELDLIIQRHIDELNEEEIVEPITYLKEDSVISEKEFELLKLLHARDVDAEIATKLLDISEDELSKMIHKLIDLEFLHYVSPDVVELSGAGIDYIITRVDEKSN